MDIKEPIKLTEEQIRTIEDILNNGCDAEVQKRTDGIAIMESRKILRKKYIIHNITD